MPNLGAPEILLILVVLVLLFGAKRLPDAARSLGRSMRIFKAETKGLRSDSRGELGPSETEEERERREFAEWKASREPGSPGSGPGSER